MSHLLRTALDAAINSNDDLEKEEAEINNQKIILSIREKVLGLKKQRKVESDISIQDDVQRMQYLQEHPEVIQEHLLGTISSKGYDMLQRELKLNSEKQVRDFLQTRMV